jgi:hypothetical protein
MKRFMKVLGVTGFAVFALCAVAVASSSAAQFTSTAAGTLTGKSTSTKQVFTAGSGTVECTTASTSGTTSLAAETQAVIVKYSGCEAFGLLGVTISPAHYTLHAGGTVDITEAVSIEVEGVFGCNITVSTKSGLSSVSYANVGAGIEESSNVSGIVYTISNHSLGLCGSSGSNGTYKGNNLVTQAGQTLTFDK